MPLGVVAKGIDHPAGHVVDRDERRHRRTALCQRLENQRRVEPCQRRAADIFADIHAADAELRRLAHHIDGKMLLLVPPDRMWRDFFRGEIPRHLANRNLILVESELHGIPTRLAASSWSGSKNPRLSCRRTASARSPSWSWCRNARSPGRIG